MRVLSDQQRDPREAFEQATRGSVGGPGRPGPRRITDPIRLAILVGMVLVIALVSAIIVASLRDEPAVGVGDASTAVPDEGQDDGQDDGQGDHASDQLAQDRDLAAQVASSGIDPALQGAAMFATQFAHTYLNFSDDRPDKREATLAPFLAPGLDSQLGWSGEGAQAVGILMPLRATRDGDRITVTVAAYASGTPYSRWIHLAVPLAEDHHGDLAVVAAPSYVPPPRTGQVDALTVPEGDQALSAELRPLVAEAMQGYGAMDVVDVAGVTAPDARIAGLGGLYTMSGVESLVVAEGGPQARTAVVEVAWDDEAIGGNLVQSYAVELVGSDGRWLVTGIRPR